MQRFVFPPDSPHLSDVSVTSVLHCTDSTSRRHLGWIRRCDGIAAGTMSGRTWRPVLYSMSSAVTLSGDPSHRVRRSSRVLGRTQRREIIARGEAFLDRARTVY